MICQEIPIRVPGLDEEARLTTYILDVTSETPFNSRRPLVLLCPGGGYEWTSEREGEPIALRFMAMGFHSAILWYSVKPAVYPSALLQVGEAVRCLKAHADEFHLDPGKIIIQGCSAGGHLAASYGVFWKKDWVRKTLGATEEELRPAGLILCYPVITSGEFAHRGSFVSLLGDRYDELVDEMSLENQVNPDVPRTFLWHTTEDEAVPVENSLYFYSALHRQGIPAELHIYERGLHGLALASPLTSEPDGTRIQKECESWIDLAGTWMEYYKR